jgi:hypothetical protein
MYHNNVNVPFGNSHFVFSIKQTPTGNFMWIAVEKASGAKIIQEQNAAGLPFTSADEAKKDWASFQKHNCLTCEAT